MGKVIFWIVVVFAVLFVLRLVNVAKAKKRRAASTSSGNKANASGNEPMVRCASCGVYLPRGEATPLPSGFSCGDAKCLPSR